MADDNEKDPTVATLYRAHETIAANEKELARLRALKHHLDIELDGAIRANRALHEQLIEMASIKAHLDELRPVHTACGELAVNVLAYLEQLAPMAFGEATPTGAMLRKIRDHATLAAAKLRHTLPGSLSKS
jgi:hypothetical protein